MNFEEIKRKMDADKMDNIHVPTNIKQVEKSKIPIEKVRKRMRGEIFTQLLIIVIFFTVPLFIEMHQLPNAVYYILMFVTSLITLLYLATMTCFLKKTSNLTGNSKDTVVAFIHDLKLTLEVYKTSVVSGSLLLPLAFAALLVGSHAEEGLFTKYITLDVSNSFLLICIIAYLLIAAFIYISTVMWADKLYGVHLKNLENTFKEFDLEE